MVLSTSSMIIWNKWPLCRVRLELPWSHRLYCLILSRLQFFNVFHGISSCIEHVVRCVALRRDGSLPSEKPLVWEPNTFSKKNLPAATHPGSLHGSSSFGAVFLHALWCRVSGHWVGAPWALLRCWPFLQLARQVGPCHWHGGCVKPQRGAVRSAAQPESDSFTRMVQP